MDKHKINEVRISEEVVFHLRMVDSVLDNHIETLSKNDIGPKAFNEAWIGYAVYAVIDFYLRKLSKLILNRDFMQAINYIKFVIYQIEKSMSKVELEYEDSTGDPILDGKKILYSMFNNILKYNEC